MKLRTIIVILAFGLCSIAYGGVAAAQAGSGPAPDYQAWFTILIGVVSLMVGAYATGLSSRITHVEHKLDALQTTISEARFNVATTHHTKEETNHQFQQMREDMHRNFNALHERLDRWHVPSTFGPKS